MVQNASEFARIYPDPAKIVELRRILDRPAHHHPDSRRSPQEGHHSVLVRDIGRDEGSAVRPLRPLPVGLGGDS